MTVSPLELQLALQDELTALAHSEVQVTNLALLAGGASQEMWRLDLTVAAGERRGEYQLVLRRQLGGKIYREALDLAREFRIMQVAYASDVLLPYPQVFLPNLLGRPAALVHRLQGETIGRRIVRAPALAEARRVLPAQMGKMLARIHQIRVRDYALASFLPHPPTVNGASSASAALPALPTESAAPNERLLSARPAEPTREWASPAGWMIGELERELDAIGEPHPALELGIRWLVRSEPTRPERITLLHGDYRLGNLMVNAKGLVAVLDWEFAHLGDPYQDLAWPLVRDWRFGNDALRLGGIAQPDDFFAAYGKEMGITIDPARVRYWEVMGNVRWAVGMLNQAQRHLRGEEPNLEFASLGRRCAEVELEILRLIRL